MTLWQSKRFGRMDHSRPTANTVAAECEHRRISNKKMFKKDKPVSLSVAYIKPPPSKIPDPFKGCLGGNPKSARHALLEYFKWYVQRGDKPRLHNFGTERINKTLLKLGLIQTLPDSNKMMVVTKKGFDWMQQQTTREKTGEFIASNTYEAEGNDDKFNLR